MDSQRSVCIIPKAQTPFVRARSSLKSLDYAKYICIYKNLKIIIIMMMMIDASCAYCIDLLRQIYLYIY